MDNQKDNFISYLEWESFNWNNVLCNIESQNKYYNIPYDSKIKINRNNEYKLSGKLTFDSDRNIDLKYRENKIEPIAGQNIKSDTILGTDANQIIKYELKHFYIGDSSTRGLPPYTKAHTEADIIFFEIEEKISNNETNSIYEFYLSGYISNTFPRGTERSKVEKVNKRRHSIDMKEADGNISFQSHGSSSDFLFIETKSFDLIVQKVNNQFLPEWANGFLIEYRKSFKQIPDFEIRKAVSEIVGFVFGTQLLKIGETHFDSNKSIVKRIGISPLGNNIIAKSKSPAQPPVKLDNIMDRNKIERILNKLIPIYLTKRDILGLDEVLWKYWISKELAIGTNLPILASALESLAENYISSNSLVLTYTNDEKDKYKNLVEDDIKSLENKLEKYDFKDRVLNFVNSPFDLSTGQKIKLFLGNISVMISNKSVENQAIRARNKMTHSSIDNSDEAIAKYIKLTRAYQTLMNRIILKILEYDETYIDYYTMGFPERKIDENIEIP